MAFDRKLFSGVNTTNKTPAIYSYKGTTNTKAEVIANSFFDPIAGILEVGDIIIATTSDTAPVMRYVVSISASNVVVTGYVLVA